MEPFLPSEIARLVYGYLDEAKCDEAARSFLERSCHLSECVAVSKEGKAFNTRPTGYCLTDILNEYCEIHSMVAECLQKLPKNSADKLWQCDSLIEQLRCLIDPSQAGQMLLVSIRVPPKESPAKGTTPPTHSHLRRIGSCNRMRQTAVHPSYSSKQPCSEDADDALSSISIDMLEHERQELACKKQSSTGKRKHGAEIANKKLSATERLENTNKKTRALLDDDISIIKIVTEASEVSKDTEHGILRLQKRPSSVGNVQAEKLSEDTPSILKGNKSASNMASDQSLEENRFAAGKPSQEPEKPQKKSVQKEGSIARPSAGRALAPKKRKASSEELSLPEEKRIPTDGPWVLLKKVDLDHLDIDCGEKRG